MPNPQPQTAPQPWQQNGSSSAASDALGYFLERYYCVLPDGFEPRSRRLFDWSWEGSRLLRLSSVPPAADDELFATNVLAVLLNVMVDDLADTVGDHALTERALLLLGKDAVRSARAGFNPAYQPYLELIWQIRGVLAAKLASWPQHSIWQVDLQRFVGRLTQAMRLGAEVQEKLQHGAGELPDFATYQRRAAPAIHTFVYGLLNLMWLPETAARERRAVLTVLHHGERYMVMSNWLATWVAEVEAGDFTSGVVLWAIHAGVVEHHGLPRLCPQTLRQKIEKSEFRTVFKRRMADSLARLARFAELQTFSVPDYIRALRQVHALHLDHHHMLKQDRRPLCPTAR